MKLKSLMLILTISLLFWACGENPDPEDPKFYTLEDSLYDIARDINADGYRMELGEIEEKFHSILKATRPSINEKQKALYFYALRNLSVIKFNQGNWGEAYKSYIKPGVDSAQKYFPFDHIYNLYFKALNVAAFAETERLERAREIGVQLKEQLEAYNELRDPVSKIESDPVLFSLHNQTNLFIQVNTVIGGLFYTLEEYDKAIEFYEETMKLVPRYGIEDSGRTMQVRSQLYGSILSNVANIAAASGKPEDATRLYQEGLKHLEQAKDTNSQLTLLYSLAEFYVEQKEFDRANAWMQKAMSLCEDFSGCMGTENQASHYKLWGYIAHKENKVDQSLQYYQKGISIISFDGLPSEENLPARQNYSTSSLGLTLLERKAAIYWEKYLTARAGGDRSIQMDNLREVDRHLALYFSVVDSIIQTDGFFSIKGNTFTDGLNFQRKISPQVERAIQANLIMGELDLEEKRESYVGTALNFLEDYRSSLLFYEVSRKKSIQLGGISEELQEEESRLLKDLDRKAAALRIHRSIRKGQEPSQDFTRPYLKAKAKWEDFLKKLKDSHPDYYQFRHGQNGLNLDKIQEHLSVTNQVYLEFFAGEERYYSFLLSPGRISANIIENKAEVDSLVRKYYSLVSKEEINSAERELLFMVLHRLYEGLLKEPMDQTGDMSMRRWRIIPDGALHQLKFEVLLPRKVGPDSLGSFNVWPYLIWDDDLHFSYQHSIRLDQQIPEVDKKFRYKLLGVAPFFATRKFEELGSSEDFFSNLTKHANIGGKKKILIGEDGRQIAPSDYLERSNSAQIQHLYTHAIARVGDPFSSAIFFGEGDSLPASFIYGSKISSELVVLGACQTGFGKNYAGEGNMSLAKAYAFAGTPSTLASYWLLTEEASNELLISFYQYLFDGQPKDVAWSNAQRYFLNNSSMELSPYQFASMGLIGKVEPLR